LTAPNKCFVGAGAELVNDENDGNEHAEIAATTGPGGAAPTTSTATTVPQLTAPSRPPPMAWMKTC
jgi:hypothetical protein